MLLKEISFVLFLIFHVCLTENYPYHIPTGNGVYGADISHYNKITNWTQFIHNEKYPLKFIFTKATEGATYTDKTFIDNWNNIIAHKVVPGAYHFYRPDDSVEQNLNNVKKNIFQNVNFDRRKHLFAVDFESNRSKRTKSALAFDLHSFLIKFEKLYDFKPFIYVSHQFYTEYVGNAGDEYNFDKYNLWVPRYGPETPETLPKPWSNSNYTIWQYTGIQKLPGIVGDVDMDWWPNPPPFVKNPQ